jgi:hypothetical protein
MAFWLVQVAAYLMLTSWYYFGPINFFSIEDVTEGRIHFGVLEGEIDVLGPTNLQFICLTLLYGMGGS